MDLVSPAGHKNGDLRHGQRETFTYHQLLSSRTHSVDVSLYVDGGAAGLRGGMRVRVDLGEMYMGSRALGDELDVCAIAAQKKEVVLGCNVQVCANQHRAGQRPSEMLQ